MAALFVVWNACSHLCWTLRSSPTQYVARNFHVHVFQTKAWSSSSFTSLWPPLLPCQLNTNIAFFLRACDSFRKPEKTRSFTYGRTPGLVFAVQQQPAATPRALLRPRFNRPAQLQPRLPRDRRRRRQEQAAPWRYWRLSGNERRAKEGGKWSAPFDHKRCDSSPGRWSWQGYPPDGGPRGHARSFGSVARVSIRDSWKPDGGRWETWNTGRFQQFQFEDRA